jgi:aryl-alcohol dehydrogenase-like predicted oxidoreductase
MKGRRDPYILSTKCAMQWRREEGVKIYSRDGKTVRKCFTPDSLRQDLEDSLRRFRTDIYRHLFHPSPAG